MRQSNRPSSSSRPLLPLLAGVLALLLAAPTAALPRYDFDARMNTVTALVAAAQRLDDARTTVRALETIGMLQSEAGASLQAGEAELAYQKLDQAYALVQLVVRRLAGQPAVITPALVPEAHPAPAADVRARRYDGLAVSVRALGEAYRSVRDELAAGGVDVSEQVAALTESAERDRAAGRLDDALPQLKQAYALLQAEIARLRGGQTLVRELRFGSAREEYEYEVDRHDTFLLLAQLLLEQPRAEPQQALRIRDAIDESLRLHWIAHKHAAAGEYRQAVGWLEQASDALAALIRGYGHDIP